MEFGPDNLSAEEVTEVHDTDDELEHEPPQDLETPRTRRTSKNIPRPRGEPGRPNSGGFSLVAELAKTGWSKKSAEQLAVGLPTSETAPPVLIIVPNR